MSAEWTGKNIILEFEGSFIETEIYLNGSYYRNNIYINHDGQKNETLHVYHTTIF